MSRKSTIRRQLDRRLSHVTTIEEYTRPPTGGWVLNLRRALGLRLKDLAKRMKITEGAVRNIEQSEAKGTITLERLRRAANALDCDLVYVLLPRSPLAETFRRQVHRRARADVNRIAATMDLEGQGLNSEEVEQQLMELSQTYLQDPPVDLWDG